MTAAYPTTEPVHEYFGLSYCNFLVVHRSIAQSMPTEWQRRFVDLMSEADRAVKDAGIETASSYTIRARDRDGKFIADPIPHYNRGRTQLHLGGEERSDA